MIEALRGGWVLVEEVCRLYDLSADEIVAWERDIDRYGVHGLRTTRLQIYRDTDNARRDGATLGALRTRYVRERRFRHSGHFDAPTIASIRRSRLRAGFSGFG